MNRRSTAPRPAAPPEQLALLPVEGAPARVCRACRGPIPKERRSDAIYCGARCSTVFIGQQERQRRKVTPWSRTIRPRDFEDEMGQVVELDGLDEQLLTERPKTRGDCLPGGCNEERPCPWLSCKHHLCLEVSPRGGGIKVMFPGLGPDELEETCALDVADRGGITLEGVAQLVNLTRERVRQIEARALLRLKKRGDL